MKTKAVLLLLFALTTLTARSEWLGDGTRGGGNVNVAEFYEVGNEVIRNLAPLGPLDFHGVMIDFRDWQQKFLLTKIYGVPGPISILGIPVDAINYPALNKIEFVESRWQSLSAEQKTRLVIHEILGLSGIDDPGFSLSLDIFMFAQGSTGLDSKFGASADACEGTRTFRGEKAKNLGSALRISGVKAWETETSERYEMKEIGCNVSITPYKDGTPRAFCQEGEGPGDEARASILVEALSRMGIYGEGAMGHMWYGAKDVSCLFREPESGNTLYECRLSAIWSYGCEAEEPSN